MCPISTKKNTTCRKRKARDIWATHKVTRNANQLYALSSFNSTKKIRFVRPNGDFTVIQTSHSHKKRNRDKRNPKQFVTNDHRFHILRSFDVIGCLGGSGRRGVSIPLSFRTRNAC